MSAKSEIDPEAFTDSEVIKDKLNTVIECQQRIEGRLEALAAAVEALTPSDEPPSV